MTFATMTVKLDPSSMSELQTIADRAEVAARDLAVLVKAADEAITELRARKIMDITTAELLADMEYNSKAFGDAGDGAIVHIYLAAYNLVASCPVSFARASALRKLLEAQEAAIRATRKAVNS